MICDVAVLPHVDAVIRTAPGFRAWMTPSESIVAIDVSDEVNVIGTSVRNAPFRFVARAVTVPMSLSRAGEWTKTTAVPGSRNRSATGFVASQTKPGPERTSSLQAAANDTRVIAAAANMTLFVILTPRRS